MADPFSSPEDPTLRYGRIEQAYRQERWQEVRTEAEDMLQQLRESADPAAPGLIPRLQILLGHTSLYGLGDPGAAAAHYGGVLESSSEEALRQTAEDGLRLCSTPEESAPLEASAAEEPPPQEPAAAAMPWSAAAGAAGAAAVGSGAAAAMPWMSQPAAARPPAEEPAPVEEPAAVIESSAQPELRTEPEPQPEPEPRHDPPIASLIPDVVEEPELIEVHQNDPHLAEEIEAAEVEALGGDPSLSAGEDPEAEERDLQQGLLRVTISASGGG